MRLCSFASRCWPRRTESAFARSRQLDKRFTPRMPAALREQKYGGWKEAMRKLLS
ncbi:MAG: hypothetical protein AB7S92_23885 [Parvibaculaceae bacterium]